MQEGRHIGRNCNGQSNPNHSHAVLCDGAVTLLDRCPKAWLMAAGDHVIALVGDLQVFRGTGILPDAGGWLDQHPHWLQAELATRERHEPSNPKR